MSKLKNSLNYIGLALVFAALACLRIWPHKKAAGFVLLAAGILCIAVYMALNLSSLKRGFKRKSFIYSSNMLLVAVLVLAILVLLNYFFSLRHVRWDFTTSKLHSLSDQSVTVLKNLKSDVIVRAFFREGNMSRRSAESLLNIYGYHSDKFKYEFIDPDKNPGLVKRFEVTQDGTMIFECGDKDSRITTSAEEDITNALIKVTREKKKTVYFLEGHGEETIEDSSDNGYSFAKGELEKLGYEVKKQGLALGESFPRDAALLIVPGPKKDLLPSELDTIRNYIGDGGRVFFMIDPETVPGFAPYIGQYGIRLEDDLIVDTVSRMLGGDYFMPVVTEYEYHAITNKFRYATFFPFARSVEIAETKPEGVTVTAIAKTSPNSWSERQLADKQVKFDKDKDKQGPVTLAVVGTVKAQSAAPDEEAPPTVTEAKPAEKEGRIAVFGDSDFVANRYYSLSGNGNFFLNTVNWLTEESDLISIQPKTQSPRTIQLTPSQGRMIFFVSVILLPLLVVLVGLSVWIRRRSL